MIARRRSSQRTGAESSVVAAVCASLCERVQHTRQRQVRQGEQRRRRVLGRLHGSAVANLTAAAALVIATRVTASR